MNGLQQRRDDLLSQVERIQLEREVMLLESFVGRDGARQALAEAYSPMLPGGYVLSPQQLQREIGWGNAALGPYISQGDDYLDGQCKPWYQNVAELQSIRGLGRWLAGSDEMAANILGNLRNYTIADGFTVKVTAKKNTGAEQLAASVQEFIDEFLDHNRFTDLGETDALLQAVIDGELLLWLRPGESVPRVQFVGGEHITEPDKPADIEAYYGDMYGFYGASWTFGVATEFGNAEHTYGYFVDWFGQGTQWDFVPECESVFLKRNVSRQCKRGISDFYIPFKRLDRGTKLFDSAVLGATIQSTIAYIKEHSQGTPQTALEAAALNSRLTGTVDVVKADGVRESVTGETYLGGRVLNVAGTKYHAGPMGTPQGPTYMDVYQSVCRRVGSRWRMPEYMVSGDASNANYSSTLVAESPFIQEIKHEQSQHARKERELLWKAIDMAAKTGRFGLTKADLCRIIEIIVVAPNPESRDPAQLEAVYDSQQAAGVLSKRTRAAQSGLDYEQEQENIAGEPKQPPPPMLHPMMGGASHDRDGGGLYPEAEHVMAGKAAALLESLASVVEGEEKWVTINGSAVKKSSDDGEMLSGPMKGQKLGADSKLNVSSAEKTKRSSKVLDEVKSAAWFTPEGWSEEETEGEGEESK